jgi:hypothetical protein
MNAPTAPWQLVGLVVAFGCGHRDDPRPALISQRGSDAQSAISNAISTRGSDGASDAPVVAVASDAPTADVASDARRDVVVLPKLTPNAACKRSGQAAESGPASGVRAVDPPHARALGRLEGSSGIARVVKLSPLTLEALAHPTRYGAQIDSYEVDGVDLDGVQFNSVVRVTLSGETVGGGAEMGARFYITEIASGSERDLDSEKPTTGEFDDHSGLLFRFAPDDVGKRIFFVVFNDRRYLFTDRRSRTATGTLSETQLAALMDTIASVHLDRFAQASHYGDGGVTLVCNALSQVEWRGNEGALEPLRGAVEQLTTSLTAGAHPTLRYDHFQNLDVIDWPATAPHLDSLIPARGRAMERYQKTKQYDDPMYAPIPSTLLAKIDHPFRDDPFAGPYFRDRGVLYELRLMKCAGPPCKNGTYYALEYVDMSAIPWPENAGIRLGNVTKTGTRIPPSIYDERRAFFDSVNVDNVYRDGTRHYFGVAVVMQ